MRQHIVLSDGGKSRHGHAKAYRAGREIDIVLILGTRRIGLGPAERAKPLQLVKGLTAIQVLNGMKHRAGMRLDRNPVLRLQH